MRPCVIRKTPIDCVGQRALQIMLYGDIRLVRGFLGCVAAFIAIALWYPGDTFERPVYRIMGQFASESQWAAAWSIVAGLLFWRTLGKPSLRRYTFVADLIALALFAVWAYFIIAVQILPVPAAAMADVASAFAAVYVMARSWESRNGLD